MSDESIPPGEEFLILANCAYSFVPPLIMGRFFVSGEIIRPTEGHTAWVSRCWVEYFAFGRFRLCC
jgi:hypothetical protein